MNDKKENLGGRYYIRRLEGCVEISINGGFMEGTMVKMLLNDSIMFSLLKFYKKNVPGIFDMVADADKIHSEEFI